jgi:hypothetical protein
MVSLLLNGVITFRCSCAATPILVRTGERDGYLVPSATIR